MGMQQHPQGGQQGQQQSNAQQHGQQGLLAPAPVPIQPRPVPPNARASGSPAPTPRPGTGQSMHGPSGLRAITPALVGSRPNTATGFRQQPAPQPSTPQIPQGSAQFQNQQQPQQLQQGQLAQQQQSVHTPISTPTSATYPPIAPAPAAGSTPGSPRMSMKRRPSGTPAPPSIAGTSSQGSQLEQSFAPQGQTQTLTPGQAQGLFHSF